MGFVVPVVIDNFESIYTTLTALLDRIRSESPKGVKQGAVAYSTAYSGNADQNVVGAADIIKKHVNDMTIEQVNALSGLKFTDPNDDAKKRQDVINSALSAWDAVASKYMKNAQQDGDDLRPNLLTRLKEYDTVISNAGTPPVTPDK